MGLFAPDWTFSPDTEPSSSVRDVHSPFALFFHSFFNVFSVKSLMCEITSLALINCCAFLLLSFSFNNWTKMSDSGFFHFCITKLLIPSLSVVFVFKTFLGWLYHAACWVAFCCWSMKAFGGWIIKNCTDLEIHFSIAQRQVHPV